MLVRDKDRAAYARNAFALIERVIGKRGLMLAKHKAWSNGRCGGCFDSCRRNGARMLETFVAYTLVNALELWSESRDRHTWFHVDQDDDIIDFYTGKRTRGYWHAIKTESNDRESKPIVLASIGGVDTDHVGGFAPATAFEAEIGADLVFEAFTVLAQTNGILR